jgi:hypothetical protein
MNMTLIPALFLVLVEEKRAPSSLLFIIFTGKEEEGKWKLCEN